MIAHQATRRSVRSILCSGSGMKSGTLPSAAGIDLNRVAAYIRERQTTDGGFFFARVPPATAGDTFYALASLRLLGLEPRDPPAARAWVEQAGDVDYLDQPRTVYHLMKSAEYLDVPFERRSRWAERVLRFANPLGGFGAWQHLDAEVISELEPTYFAVRALSMAGIGFDHDRAAHFVHRYRNADGGFGRAGKSTYASTCYAVAALAALGAAAGTAGATARWLHAHDAVRERGYLEDVYWYVMALRSLGESPANAGHVLSFVRACWHPSGGFARNLAGIANLENTYRALQLLAVLGDAVPEA